MLSKAPNINGAPNGAIERAAAADNTPQWGIREFAKMFSITTRTLRFYEDKGLIAPDRRSGGRVYGARDYVRTERILRAKDMGFSLDDIGEVFEIIDGHVHGKTELLRRKGRIEQAVSDLRRRREMLESTVDELEVLLQRIERYSEDAPEDGVFQHAAAYEAIFAKTLIENQAALDMDEAVILNPFPAVQAP